MATVPLPKSKTKAPVAEPSESVSVPAADDVIPEVSQPPRMRRRFPRWLILFGVLAALVYFLPDIVARTSLRQQVPRLLFPRWSGSIELGETSLGWFAPIDIRAIKLTDRDGQTLATVDHLRSSATLLNLALQPSRLGEFQLEKTVVHFQVKAGASNWVKPLQELSNGDSQSASSTSWSLLFPQLQMLVTNAEDGLEHTLESLDLKVAMGEANASGLTIEATFPPEPGADQPSLAVMATLPSSGLPSLQLAAQKFDLVRLEPITQLLYPTAVVRGQMSGTLKSVPPADDAAPWTIESDLQLKSATVAGWEVLSGDILTLADISLRGRILQTDDRVECDHVRLQTDFAKLTAQGTVRWTGTASLPTTTNAAFETFGDDFQLTAVIDAARAAQQLPNTLRLKSGVAIASGQLQCTVQTTNDDKGRVLDGTVRLADLAANIEGQERRWSAPVDAQVVLRPSADGVQCDRLSLRSDFCTILGQGTPNAAKFRVTADLDRLWQEIAPIVDWQGASLAGNARLDGTMQRSDAGSVTLHMDGQGDGLRYGSTQQPVWSEPHLTLVVDVTGQGPVSAPWTTITSGNLTLQSGDDRCEARLLKSVEWNRTDPTLPMNLAIRGDWTRWQQRLRPVWSDPSIALAGHGELTGTLNYSSSAISISEATLKSQPLQITLTDWQIADPDVTATLQGTWDRRSQTWATPRTHLQGECGEITWTDGRYDLGSTTGNPAGRLDINVNVGKVSRWQRGEVQHHLLGQLAGIIDFRPSGDALQSDVDVRLTNAVVAGLSAEPQPRWIALWREPELSIKGNVRHRLDSTPWDISSLQLTASGLSIATNGRIDPREDATELDLKGQLAYDWDQLMSRLDPSWAQRIQLSGRGDRPFFVKGTLRSATDGSVSMADLAGEGQLAWEQATVYGLPLTASSLSAQFAQGQGQLGPLDLNVAQGRVHLAPRLDFRQTALLTLPVGRVVDQIQLTPAVCQQMLKYALPVAADAAEMDGAFSLDVDENVWPLMNPQAGKARGSLSIHRARIVPGPLANRLVGTVEQVRALLERRAPANTNAARFVLELPEQTVALAQMNGRVYHDRMTVRIDNTELVTGGSVGFDETLQLTFLLPIQEKWVRGTPALAKLAGQSLRIPVTGTLSQPQIDPSILAQLAQQATGSAIEKAIDDTVQKQLDRFLPRRN